MGESPKNDTKPEQIEQLLDTVDLADALESDRFKQFLDHLPVAIAVSELQPNERIIYANAEFERLSGSNSQVIVGNSWKILRGTCDEDERGHLLGTAIIGGSDFIGSFIIPDENNASHVIDVWANIIEDDQGVQVFRLVALIGRPSQTDHDREKLEHHIREKDTLLRELQHRVKNNLQMITALIRLESRNTLNRSDGERFDRLAGRVESLALLYQALSDEEQSGEVDLGVYLSQVASAIMKTHAVEGLRLDLKVDTWPVSINVAMPAGLVVNELMTNALKHAFEGRDGGTIKLHSLVDDVGCKVIIADDGIGLPSGVEWPKPGKLSALIVRSLRENAGAKLHVSSIPGAGTTVTIQFTRAAATEN